MFQIVATWLVFSTEEYLIQLLCLSTAVFLLFLLFHFYLLFRAEYKPRGYYLEHFWQADMGYIGHAMIGVKVPNK